MEGSEHVTITPCTYIEFYTFLIFQSMTNAFDLGIFASSSVFKNTHITQIDVYIYLPLIAMKST
jgi:hypothetical protein